MLINKKFIHFNIILIFSKYFLMYLLEDLVYSLEWRWVVCCPEGVHVSVQQFDSIWVGWGTSARPSSVAHDVSEVPLTWEEVDLFWKLSRCTKNQSVPDRCSHIEVEPQPAHKCLYMVVQRSQMFANTKHSITVFNEHLCDVCEDSSKCEKVSWS